MTRVFVDARLVSGPADLAEPLRHLSAAGYELVLLDGIAAGLHGLPAVVELSREPGGWFLASDAGRCRGARRLGLRSILVGPHVVSPGLPVRCDLSARDLVDAALTILASEAMP